MELYVYRYSKPSKKQAREQLSLWPPRVISSLPGPDSTLYPTPRGEKDACQKSALWRNNDGDGGGR